MRRMILRVFSALPALLLLEIFIEYSFVVAPRQG
jgi:hypothetical protein